MQDAFWNDLLHLWKRFELALVVSEIKCVKKERTLTNTQNDKPFLCKICMRPIKWLDQRDHRLICLIFIWSLILTVVNFNMEPM
jgi:hypothetical protein